MTYPRTALASLAGCILALALPTVAQGVTFPVMNTNDSGAGSLRAAITSANQAGGPDRIEFAIPGAGPHTIAPASPLPEVNSPLTIDGYSQPGTSPSGLKIELSGASQPSGSGLVVNASGSAVRGLAINRFPGDGIEVWTDQLLVAGNFIGLDPNGETDLGNGGAGIFAAFGPNTIGGDEPSERNVISGNARHGIETGAQAQVIGNFIGTDKDGASPLGNSFDGLFIQASADGSLVDGNLIAGNAGNGIGVAFHSTENRIVGNRIGDTNEEVMALGNGQHGVKVNGSNNSIGETRANGNTIGINVLDGVHIAGGLSAGNKVYGNTVRGSLSDGIEIADGSTGNLIGDLDLQKGNTITHNAGAGVRIETGGTGNPIVGNSMVGNSGLGIDLNNPGADPRDDDDASDSGGNNGQNSPEILSAHNNAAGVTVSLRLDATPSKNFSVDLYGNHECDGGLPGEGRDHLGRYSVSTNSSGLADVSVVSERPAIRVREASYSVDEGAGTLTVTLERSVGVAQVTATATLDGNTSEFSNCLTVSGTPGAASAAVATADGTATAGSDYGATSGRVNFGLNDTTRTIDVPLADDTAGEAAESFELALSDPRGAQIAQPASATVTIAASDGGPPNGGGNDGTDGGAGSGNASDEGGPGGDTGSGGDTGPGGEIPGDERPPRANAEPDSAIDAVAKVAPRRKLKGFSGSASDDGRIARVEIALVRQAGRKCYALGSNGRFRAFKPAGRTCQPTRFLAASGTGTWSFRLKKRLPAGRYVLYSRATDEAGATETSFDSSDGNRRRFRVR